MDDSLVWNGHNNQSKINIAYQSYLSHHYLPSEKKRSLMLKPPEKQMVFNTPPACSLFLSTTREVEILRLRLEVDIGRLDIEPCPMPIQP